MNLNLQSGGVLLILLVAVACTVLYRRGRGLSIGTVPARKWLEGFLNPATPDDDPVEMAAAALVAGARMSNKILYAPLHLWFRCDATTRGFMMANPADIHSQVVLRANELGENEARRRGATWHAITGVTMNYPIAVGSNTAEVSFTPFTGCPFESAPPSARPAAQPTSQPEWEPEPTPDVRPRPLHQPSSWTAGTIPPRQRMPRPASSVVVTALVAGKAQEAVIPLHDGVTSFQVGRDSGCGLVLPSLPGISARHLLFTFEAGQHFATDMSTHGSWIESESGWRQLPAGQKTPVPEGSRVLLDADQQVVLSLTEGARR